MSHIFLLNNQHLIKNFDKNLLYNQTVFSISLQPAGSDMCIALCRGLLKVLKGVEIYNMLKAFLHYNIALCTKQNGE